MIIQTIKGKKIVRFLDIEKLLSGSCNQIYHCPSTRHLSKDPNFSKKFQIGDTVAVSEYILTSGDYIFFKDDCYKFQPNRIFDDEFPSCSRMTGIYSILSRCEGNLDKTNHSNSRMDLEITNIILKKTSEFTDEDAIKNGFSNKEEFLEKNSFRTYVFLYDFKLKIRSEWINLINKKIEGTQNAKSNE